MNRKTWGITGVSLGVIVLSGLLYLLFFQRATTSQTIGLVKAEHYNHVEEGQGTCAAYTAACGVCLGTVINKECYVDKDKLTPEELKVMGF
jgi:hypothetical protein